MTVSLHIENSVIKLKPDVRVLEVQLNMKLQWSSHLQQIEAGHVTKMLALSRLGASMWGATFAKARQVYSAMVRSGITFGASVWHQRGKEGGLSGMERRLEALQNQALRHVADVFKKVKFETLEAETSEQATGPGYTTQSSRRQNAGDSASMRDHTCSPDRN